MPQEQGVDTVPEVRVGAAPQAFTDIHIVGNQAVEMLDALVRHLEGVQDQKGAVLRMLGIFHSAIDKEILIQERGKEPQVVLGLWQ